MRVNFPTVRLCLSRRFQSSSNTVNTQRSFDIKLLEILSCPITQSRLTYDQKQNQLVSKEGRVYPILKDGLPDLRPPAQEQIKETKSK